MEDAEDLWQCDHAQQLEMWPASGHRVDLTVFLNRSGECQYGWVVRTEPGGEWLSSQVVTSVDLAHLAQRTADCIGQLVRDLERHYDPFPP